MFWLAREDTSAVVLGEAPPVLAAVPGRHPAIGTAFTTDANGESVLRYELGNGQSIQLVHHGGMPSEAPVAALVPLNLEGFDRLESISRLLAALHGRAVPLDTRLTRHQRARLRRMLQCLDGYRDGANQQEIAQFVLRVGPLGRDDWQDSSARHAIKSLLRDARAMVAGGYRALLRHRRRS